MLRALISIGIFISSSRIDRIINKLEAKVHGRRNSSEHPDHATKQTAGMEGRDESEFDDDLGAGRLQLIDPVGVSRQANPHKIASSHGTRSHGDLPSASSIGNWQLPLDPGLALRDFTAAEASAVSGTVARERRKGDSRAGYSVPSSPVFTRQNAAPIGGAPLRDMSNKFTTGSIEADNAQLATLKQFLSTLAKSSGKPAKSLTGPSLGPGSLRAQGARARAQAKPAFSRQLAKRASAPALRLDAAPKGTARSIRTARQSATPLKTNVNTRGTSKYAPPPKSPAPGSLAARWNLGTLASSREFASTTQVQQSSSSGASSADTDNPPALPGVSSPYAVEQPTPSKPLHLQADDFSDVEPPSGPAGPSYITLTLLDDAVPEIQASTIVDTGMGSLCVSKHQSMPPALPQSYSTTSASTTITSTPISAGPLTASTANTIPSFPVSGGRLTPSTTSSNITTKAKRHVRKATAEKLPGPGNTTGFFDISPSSVLDYGETFSINADVDAIVARQRGPLSDAEAQQSALARRPQNKPARKPKTLADSKWA